MVLTQDVTAVLIAFAEVGQCNYERIITTYRKLKLYSNKPSIKK
jgi:hypothetical protein